MSKKKILIIGTDLYEYNRNRVFTKALDDFANAKKVEVTNSWQGKWQFVKEVFACRRYDYVFVMYQAIDFVTVLTLIKPFLHAEVIYDAFTSRYNVWCLDRELFVPNSIKGWYHYLRDAISFRVGDILLFETEEMKNFFVDLFYIPAGTPKLIAPIYVDISEIDDLIDKAEKEESPYYENEVMNVLYFGNYIPVQGTPYIVKAASKLQGEPIHFTMIGDGQAKRETVSLANDLDVSNITFRSSMEFKELAPYIYYTDVSLGTFGDSKKAEVVISNKLIESMAFGAPVITGKSSSRQRYFTDKQDVLYCSLADANDLAKVLRWAKEHPQEIQQVGQRGRNCIETNFRKELLVDYFHKALSTNKI